MTTDNHYLPIKELSIQSGVPISTIKYYLRQGVLPNPVKMNRTTAYYTTRHLELLKVITRIKNESSLSLEHIREIIQAAEISTAEAPSNRDFKYSLRHQKIIEVAQQLFEKRGYEKTTIDDIVKKARISKNTFYLHFKNKKELFQAAFKKIFQEMFMDTINEVGEESDITAIFPKLIPPFFRSYGKWNTMISLLRAATISEPDFNDMFEKTIRDYITPIVPLIDHAVKKGSFRKINGRLLAVMLLGIMDYAVYMATRNAFDENTDELMRQVLDMILNGVVNK
jgi:AcrR family transcriptional regulator